MLTWLNHYVGVQWATYLALLFGALALIIPFYLGAKVLRKRSIRQNARATFGNVIQVAGNVKTGGRYKTERDGSRARRSHLPN